MLRFDGVGVQLKGGRRTWPASVAFRIVLSHVVAASAVTCHKPLRPILFYEAETNSAIEFAFVIVQASVGGVSHDSVPTTR